MTLNETFFTTSENLALSDEGCTQLFIDSEKINSNLDAIRNRLTPGTKIMAIIKASAYGTDDITLAKLFDEGGVDMFGVAHAEEGIILRRAGIRSPIFVTHAPPFEAAKIVKWNLEVAVDNLDAIEALAVEADLQNKTVYVHLHVDTGMNRFGCRPEEALALAQEICNYPNLQLRGVMSHFHSADIPSSDLLSAQQIAQLDRTINTLESAGIEIPLKHIANSSAVLRFDMPQYNLARIGLALYGVHPCDGTRTESPLQLALTLQSRVTHLKEALQGEQISYGGRYTVKRPREKIATVPIGYHDGIHRCYGGRAYCLVKGMKAPFVGNVCMDFLMIDVTDIPDVSVGDLVTLFGEDPSGNSLTPEEFAAYGGSIPHELIVCLGPRIKRIWH